MSDGAGLETVPEAANPDAPPQKKTFKGFGMIPAQT
jgi:hypothetical protein